MQHPENANSRDHKTAHLANSPAAAWHKSAIIYALDVARFYDSNGDGVGDFRGLIAKLDYLVDLGVNCLWLLPFYPSPRHDNGYDVAHYKEVNDQLGTLEDFRLFMEAAKARGLRIIIDLVIHHSSDKHPWFIAATNENSPRYRDYYMWTDQIKPDIQAKNSFPTVEKGVWHYSPRVKAYYRHQFYRFEPDLNLDNPAVRQEIYDIIDFWLSFGIDGFRVDAATHILRNNGIENKNTGPEKFFEEIRRFIANRNKDAILIAEADVGIAEIPEFIGQGNRFHLLYNFLLNGAIFASLAYHTADAIKRVIKIETSTRQHGTWLNFIRNADELNLERLSAAERKKVLDLFAPDPHVQIFQRGIRRRLPPMLGNDQSWIRMAYVLLFSLPGSPMLLYGEELGMGDNPALRGRDSVRVPMQWSNQKNAGFSGATVKQLIAPVKTDQTYGYHTINTNQQQKDPDSLYIFMKNLITVRQNRHIFAQAEVKVLDLSNVSLLGLLYIAQQQSLCVLINLSHKTQYFTMPLTLSGTMAHDYKVILGSDALPADSLPPLGYSWLWYDKRV